jgi:predicted MPP superfamily phosphohydrolase
MRLVHISDVQGDGRTTPERLKNYARLVNEQRPDVIFFAGDLITSGERYIEATGEVMGLMEARLAKIAAVGDHDLFSNREMAVNALKRNGFEIADDTTVVVQTETGKISVTLLTHTYRQRPDSADLEKAIVGADGGLKVLLVHQPAESLVAFAHQRGYDLFLAGHTHGGGVAFGIPGLFLISPAAFESRYVSGFFEVGEMIVSVTNGIGMTLAPIRFHAPAQITVIRLVS